jgi:hemin uptake protein HemP
MNTTAASALDGADRAQVHPSAAPDAPRDAASPRAIARISSDQLLAGSNEVHIEHRGSIYRLKQTSLGKLILTK